MTITVTDVDEPPAAPDAPTVVSGKDNDPSNDPEESTTSLFVVWHAPENTGPDINVYDVEYKKSTEALSFGTSSVDEIHEPIEPPRLVAGPRHFLRCTGAGHER